MSGYRYGPYHDGPDPLEPPYDVRGAVDALGEQVLEGTDPAAALRDLMRRGMSGHRGLDDMLRRVRDRQREIRSRGRLDGVLDQVRSMLEADARGQHEQQDFDDFMAEYGDLFPDSPANLEELVDSLVRRMAAAQRLLDSLTDEQRDELAGLMSNALEDAGLAAEMARLADALRARRPDMDEAMPRARMTGQEPLGLSDATTALGELADLAELE